MKIGCVIPTIPTREAYLERALAGYEAATRRGYELDIVIPEGFPTVGEAWNDGAEDVDADIIHFGLDDAEPHPGWLDTAVSMLEQGVAPSARMLQADGSLQGCGSMGGGMLLGECETGTPCRSGPIPIVTREMWNRVGEFMPGHYYCDDDWHWRASRLGYDTQVCREYCFTHYGRSHTPVVERAQNDMQMFLDRVAKGGARCELAEV